MAVYEGYETTSGFTAERGRLAVASAPGRRARIAALLARLLAAWLDGISRIGEAEAGWYFE